MTLENSRVLGVELLKKEGYMINSELSISDWISFLSSEKHSNTSNVIGFGSFMLAGGIAIFAVRTTVSDSLPTVIVGVVAVVVLLSIYFRVISPIRRRTIVAAKLLDKIMKEEERDVSKIKAEWKNALLRRKKSQNK